MKTSALRFAAVAAMVCGFAATAAASWTVDGTTLVEDGTDNPWKFTVTVNSKVSPATLSVTKVTATGDSSETNKKVLDLTTINGDYVLISFKGLGTSSDTPTATSKKVSKIILPPTITTCPSQSFRGTNGVEIDPGFFKTVEMVDSQAFRGATLSGDLDLSSLSTLSLRGFQGTQIASVDLGENLTAIGEYAFLSCSSLSNVVMRGAVTTIGSYAFQNCSKLAEYTYSSYPVTFGTKWNDKAKTGTGVRAFVPKSNYGWQQVMADSTAFTPWADCTDKQQDYFDAFGADAQEPAGYTTVPMAMWLVKYDDGGSVETYAVDVAAVPGDCSVTTNIQPGADGKYEVGTEASFTAVGTDFVRWYGDVDDAQVSNRTITLTVEHDMAIAPYFKRDWTVNGTKMSDGYWNATVSGTLENGLTLKSITPIPAIKIFDLTKPIADGYRVVAIGDAVFGSSTAADAEKKGGLLEEIYMPATIESLGNQCFRFCTKAVFNTEFLSFVKTFSASFSSCGGLKGDISLDAVEALGSSSFAGTAISSVVLGEQLTTVGSSAFTGCSSLTNVVFGASVATVGTLSFQQCGSLSEYHFASCPTFESGWDNHAKSGTGVRAFIPANDPGWQEILSSNEVFTAWRDCTTKAKYREAFGVTARRPLGYTTSPHEMWLVSDQASGFMILVK